MAYPVSTNPRSLSHLRVVIDRLRAEIASSSGGGSGGTYDTGVAAVALTAGDVVYAPSAGNVDQAQADALATSKVIGIVLADTLITASPSIQTSGVVTVSTWSLTTNTVYYLDPTTPGAITATAPTTPGQVVVPIGIAVSATSMKLLLNPLVLL